MAQKYLDINGLERYHEGLVEYMAEAVGTQADMSVKDPTNMAYIHNVPEWVRSETKPEYDATEVNADTAGTAENLVKTHNEATDAHKDIRDLVQAIDTQIKESTWDDKYTQAEVDTKDTNVLTSAKSYADNVSATALSDAKQYVDTNYLPAYATAVNAEKVNGLTVESAVPADAKFTDTVYVHPISGVIAGTYKSVTVDANGHVTAGTNPTTLAGYGITDAEAKGSAESAVSSHNASAVAHSDIRELITNLTTRLNALADSDDETLDQMSEIVAYIKDNKELIDSITTSKVNVSDIVDNLTTNVANKPLSAAQGVEIKALIDALEDVVDTKANTSALTSHVGDTTAHITSTERTNWNDANSKKHTHSNKSILDNTTASYTIAEQTKLSGIATGAEVNQNAFSNVVVGSTTISADNKTDSLTFVAGDNVTITPDATNDKITISAKDTVYTHPSTHAASMITGLSTVATSGNYNDLSNKPSIPSKVSELTNDAGYKTTDNNTTYSISKSGNTITLTGSDGSTTSVTDSNTTYSKLSQFTNDSGYITGITKADVTGALGYTPPTTDTNTWRPLGTTADTACAGNDSRLSNSRPASDVYSWAKASSKPTYTASEVGADASGSAASALSSAKSYTDTKISALINGAPTTLDTLKEIADAMAENDEVVEALNTAIGTKVDKVSGKGLSTNDYTTTEKNKLAGIAAGAEVNVQSDWNATSGDAFIKNKPTFLVSGKQTSTSSSDGGSNVYTFTDSAGNTSTLTVKNGSKGSTGATGATGPKGDTGAQGPAGTTPTIKAASGSNIGSVGTPSVTASTSGTTTTFTFNYLKGAKGDKGDTGATGATGPQGPKGDTGATGPQGPAGTNATTTSVATTSANGLMSAAMVTKLNGIATGANAYTHPSTHAASMITGLATVATSGKYSDLSGRPSSLPASDVYSWAKAASKPSYTYSEVGAAAASHGHTALTGTYTGNGGNQPPSYVGANAVKCNMMDGFVGTSTSFASYADVLMMNAYSWSDVPYATAIAIQKTNGVPRAWIASGGNTSKWAGSTEIITANNIGSQSVNYANSAGSAGAVAWGNVSGKPSSYTPSSHNQAASTITAGTFAATGVVAATGTDYTTNRIRNGVFTTTDPGAGASSSYANGSIIYVYE